MPVDGQDALSQAKRIRDSLEKAGFEAWLGTHSWGGAGTGAPSIAVGPQLKPVVQLTIFSPVQIGEFSGGHPELLESRGELVAGNVWIRLSPFGSGVAPDSALGDVPRIDQIKACAAS
jgi:hypothetical protein